MSKRARDPEKSRGRAEMPAGGFAPCAFGPRDRTKAQIAAAFGKDPKTVYRWAVGEMAGTCCPHERGPAKALRFNKTEVRAWLIMNGLLDTAPPPASAPAAPSVEAPAALPQSTVPSTAPFAPLLISAVLPVQGASPVAAHSTGERVPMSEFEERIIAIFTEGGGIADDRMAAASRVVGMLIAEATREMGNIKRQGASTLGLSQLTKAFQNLSSETTKLAGIQLDLRQQRGELVAAAGARRSQNTITDAMIAADASLGQDVAGPLRRACVEQLGIKIVDEEAFDRVCGHVVRTVAESRRRVLAEALRLAARTLGGRDADGPLGGLEGRAA